MANTQAVTSQLIFVGGLSADTDGEQIRNYVGKFTEVLSVKIAQDRKLKQSKGYALVKVPNHADVSKLLETRHNINGRRVDIQLAAKRSEKQQWKDQLKKRKVFVRDIDTSISNEQFERFISNIPGVKSGYIIRDYHTFESKGYGYIEFLTDEHTKAVLDKGLILQGSSLTVLPYKYKYEPKEVISDKDYQHLAGLKEKSIKSGSQSFGENLVQTDSQREEGDGAMSLRLTSHGNSSPNSEPERTLNHAEPEVPKRKMEYLTSKTLMNQSLENYRFNLSVVNMK